MTRRHRYLVDAVVTCRSGCRLGHLFSVLAEVEYVGGYEGPEVDVRSIRLVRGSRSRFLDYSRLPAYVRFEVESAVIGEYLDQALAELGEAANRERDRRVLGDA